MKNFITIDDLPNWEDTLASMQELKANPTPDHIGQGRRWVNLFNRLRTRLSTQKAARLLGFEVMVEQ